MTDVRKQLTEALNAAEERAQGLLRAAQEVSLELKEPKLLGRWIPGWGWWKSVEAMCSRELRLIERDRALLADITPGGEGHWLASRVLEGMAASWLDSPEAS